MRKLLITGTPRSSTTPIGKVLASCVNSFSLHEPFNFHTGFVGLERYFYHQESLDFSRLLAQLPSDAEGLLRLRYSNVGFFPENSVHLRIAKLIFGNRTVSDIKRARRLYNESSNLIIKDPIALFLSDCLSRKWECKVVYCLRNPFLLASSFKKQNWSFPLAHLEPIYPNIFTELKEGVSAKIDFSDPIFCALLLWRCSLQYFLEDYKGHQILNTEFLFSEPRRTYSDLISRCGLKETSKTKKVIDSYVDGASKDGSRTHNFTRNLKKLRDSWKDRMNESEISFVERIVGERWEYLKDKGPFINEL